MSAAIGGVIPVEPQESLRSSWGFMVWKTTFAQGGWLR
jgi:hypothetical protein